MQTTGWEEEFREYVRTRGPALLRAAHQLTGHPLDAEDLLQNALTKTYLAWERIEDRGALDGYVRRAMVNINISQWRRRKLEEYPSDELPEIVTDPVVWGRCTNGWSRLWRSCRSGCGRRSCCGITRT